ncbi:MAG: zinc ribbon domain-containing protein [Candidatus Acidiferrum sp.]
MSDYQQKISGSFSERKRLIQLRRKKEKLRFWQEFRIIPRWLVYSVIALYLIAQGIALYVNLNGIGNGGQIFPPEFQDRPVIASLILAGIITMISLTLSIWIFMVAYVNRDAKRRGMSSGLWTLLVIILSGGYFVLGFMIYFLMREPLPYPCPQCGASVGARFNFCPNCKCNLHPSCPNCKHEVVETDKFCPYCAYELTAVSSPANVPQNV